MAAAPRLVEAILSRSVGMSPDAAAKQWPHHNAVSRGIHFYSVLPIRVRNGECKRAARVRISFSQLATVGATGNIRPRRQSPMI